MSFKSNFETKALGILADVTSKKQKLAATPKDLPDEKAFSTAPGRTGDLQDRKWLTSRVADLQMALEKASGQGIAIPLAQLVEVPGRRRALSDEAFGQLRENLRTNDLVTPITVRKLGSGEFEVVSGHNRVRAYRELQKECIQAVVQDTDDLRTRINSFYANLLQTDLTDFEKYQGFVMLQEKLSLSQADIARHSGMSEQFVSQMMAFRDLPSGALAIIEANPAVLGMDAAYKLALITKKHPRQGARVVDAIEKLSAGDVDQKGAVKLAGEVSDESKPTQKLKPIVIKSGKSNYCDMHRVNKTLRIQFKSAEEAQAVENAVREVLQRRAETLK